MELIDEAEDFAVGIDDLFDDGFEAVFEFAAELVPAIMEPRSMATSFLFLS